MEKQRGIVVREMNSDVPRPLSGKLRAHGRPQILCKRKKGFGKIKNLAFGPYLGV